MLEKVECAADPKQSYALYVPTRFDPKVRSPVLFCFDPGARGRVPVERFAAAAEKFGYIVAGSNNSRNGPWPANVAAIDAMIRDVDGFFPLDEKRVYVAGLSGGARVACQLAMNGLAQGVVACSAAFPDGTTPDKVAFAFFGTAGVTDFNYQELRRVDRELEERRTTHRVVIHQGGHEWLSSDLAMQALGWLDLQAMRTGTLATDPVRLQAEFGLRRDAAPAAPGWARFTALKALATDFKGLEDTAALEKEVAQLAASRDVRNAIKAARAAGGIPGDRFVDGSAGWLRQRREKNSGPVAGQGRGAVPRTRNGGARFAGGLHELFGERARHVAEWRICAGGTGVGDDDPDPTGATPGLFRSRALPRQARGQEACTCRAGAGGGGGVQRPRACSTGSRVRVAPDGPGFSQARGRHQGQPRPGRQAVG